ncbi:MAG: S1 RNA-binding domain-containing protein [Leptospiraceae bacterium]|nr:S1 RNA-binding domain-containing protein [Leptospiraceae bacterium]
MKSGNEVFAKLLEESFKKRKSLESGAMFLGKVSSIQDDYIFIKLTEEALTGIVAKNEFVLEEKKISIGEELKVYFLREEHGDYYFTTCLTTDEINEETLGLALAKEIPVLGQVGNEINGGYEIKIGEFQAFCPFSQISAENKSKNLTGSQFKFIINEISSKTKKILVSQKKISDKEKVLKREILQGELKEGSHVTCTIKSIHNFGLIVDLNGLDALVPLSEATFKKNPDLNKEFKIGETHRGKVLSLDWKTNKFSVTLKDSTEDPWAKKIPFKEGDIVKVQIESIKPFGVFVKFDDHFHGLVPNKETGLSFRIPAQGHFKIGEEVDVFITEINPEKKQIAASIAKAKETKAQLEYSSYISEQSVSHSSSFGLLLKKSLKK